MDQDGDQSPKKSHSLYLYTFGGVMLKYAADITINKYGSHWSGGVIICIWLAALLPFAIWALTHEKALLSRVWLKAEYQKHPVSIPIVVLIFVWVAFSQILQVIRFHQVSSRNVTSTRALQAPVKKSNAFPQDDPPPRTSPIPSSTRLRKPTKPSKPQRQTPSLPLPIAPAPSPTLPTVSCPDNSGNCAAVNNGTQTVNQFGPPPLQVTFSKVSDPSPTSDGVGYTQYFTIYTNESWEPVAFSFRCDAPIKHVDPMGSTFGLRMSGGYGTDIYWESPPITPRSPKTIQITSEKPLHECFFTQGR